MVGKIKFKGVMKIYLQWPFYLFFLLLAGSIGICFIHVRAGMAAVALSVLYLLTASLVFTKYMRRYLDELGYKDIYIESDGNISCENAAKLYENGSDIFVAGTSSIFKEGDMDELIKELRSSIGW